MSSERKYLSGAAKRKLGAEKHEKHEKLLKKIPTLSSLWSSRSGEQNLNESNESENNSTSDIVADELNNEEAEQSSFDDEESLKPSTPDTNSIQNDAGLWDIKSNLSILQKYWSKNGIFLSNFVRMNEINF